LESGRTMVVNDIEMNPLWLPLPDEPLSPQMGSALCVPLIHAGEPVGVMTLAHPAREYFTADAINLTATISEMGAAALRNTLLVEIAREAEQRYATLFDDAIVPIIITDVQGVIQVANRRACEFLGYSRDELTRHTIATVHGEGVGGLISTDYDRFQRGHEIRFRATVWPKGGAPIPDEVYVKQLNHGAVSSRNKRLGHILSSREMVETLPRYMTTMVYHDM